MIEFKRQTLPNGLRVLALEDYTTPMAVVNVLYNVGSKDEEEAHTGLAHLFEHLMFGGSRNVPVFDEPLQQAGGENNAFTSTDLTNYYITVPAENIETALWLESDRMLELAFTPGSLEVQRDVVVEEFKQRYLNQPYGDAWLLLRPLVYKQHPYKWATIGKNIEDIENVQTEVVKAFYNKHYHPGNAILVVAGSISTDRAFELAAKWFGEIPAKNSDHRVIEREPEQLEPRELTVNRQVPADVVYLAFKSPAWSSGDFVACDALSHILGGGKTGRLYQKLVQETEMCTDAKAYMTGEEHEGMLVAELRLARNGKAREAAAAALDVIHQIATGGVEDTELDLVKARMETAFAAGRIDLLERAMQLAMYEKLGGAEMINTEQLKYGAVTAGQVQACATKYLRNERSNTLYYLANG